MNVVIGVEFGKLDRALEYHEQLSTGGIQIKSAELELKSLVNIPREVDDGDSVRQLLKGLSSVGVDLAIGAIRSSDEIVDILRLICHASDNAADEK